ncbi:MAG: DUF192 domain-containing protein [Acidobacteria bacterium]|nr:MAG: DUF192 domain-containing protein [Acidobacteriota bacterium]
MFREEIPDGAGMLFVFDESDRHPFWMYRCRTALDIVWLDEEWRVLHVAEEVPPCAERPCPSYEPPAPARYVIEVGPGRARPLGLVPGARVVVEREEGR